MRQFLALQVPLNPMAMPTSAFLSAGASFYAISSHWHNVTAFDRTSSISSFCFGVVLAIQEVSKGFFSSFFGKLIQ